ncbi:MULTISPECIES: class I SAM-dependent DNA methyltransferase [Rhodococcus]|uniref:class I SAM-dependent DNA methyltransferase n=1 Tax=Rhodococcus TaxID=1827 RepID=UPI00056044A4|nr:MULTISPECIES: DNA methyltransferase [Rhodococcus]ANQ76035.1 hypothetical protein AOT96_33870 [Rhodococcus sp. 008]MCJ0901659.1 class I SAM-dependent DNA methyltransferase [Rhodococcus sp. ARC_M13]
MTEHRLLDLVDSRDFRTLFIDELGWGNPDHPDLKLEVDDRKYVFKQVAGYMGLRIWHCPVLPPRKVQRVLDELVGKDSHERLIIFTDEQHQDWRWPRRSQLGSTNAKLLAHEYIVGDRSTHLSQRLQAIELDFDEELHLVELLNRMRDAFDKEAETASVQAARLMSALYGELEASGIEDHDATLLLARLLFLFFGDDAEMKGWETGLFQSFIRDRTTENTLHNDLQALFHVLRTSPNTRKLPVGSPFDRFRYINGGLYEESINISPLTSAFRNYLLEACEFDWTIISPAVFGSMFQTVKSKEARRHGGEHYTTEENILKTIRPLFLDEYTERLEDAWDDKAKLTKLHNELGRLLFLDPACGCGNFLIVAYRELRALELEILKRRRDLDIIDNTDIKISGVDRAQLSFDVTGDIKVTLDHFFGIEIEEWPARIAETAMLLVDHLANQRMAQEFGYAPDRLPIKIAPTIHHANALRLDWNDVVEASDDVVILGNPPFVGGRTKDDEQKYDMQEIWGGQYIGDLDYVTCWYVKAVKYYGKLRGRWAFVSTNSICQGIPVPNLWRPILEEGWRCRFAHRSFQWETEAPGGAAVHVSIVGFDRSKTSPKPVLWTYPEGGRGEGLGTSVSRINPYLIEGPNLLVESRLRPFNSKFEQVNYANKPSDGGNLVVTEEEYEEIVQDPIAAKYLRKFIGAKELLHDLDRWCLWIDDNDDLEDLNRSPILAERMAGVKDMRNASKAASTRAKAGTPYKFGQIQQPSTDYLAIPKTVSTLRRFLPVAYLSPDIIASDKVYTVPDPDGFLLGVFSSTMFIVWMKTIGGRLKSDVSFSNKLTYNTFPMPIITSSQRQSITDAASLIVGARKAHRGLSLARMYDPLAMPSDLLAAHDEVDRVIDKIFGRVDVRDEADRQKVLFRNYAILTKQEFLL